SSVSNGQALLDSLVNDNKSLRQTALDAEKRLVELDAAFRDTQAELEVAVAARRMLQEELQRLTEEHAKSIDELGRWYAMYPGTKVASARSTAMLPDRDLNATVMNVRRNNNETLVEIGAGSRDGVKE